MVSSRRVGPPMATVAALADMVSRKAASFCGVS